MPKLPAKNQKNLDEDMQALLELFDWLGLVQAVTFGRDGGAIQACKFKMLHPKRVSLRSHFGSRLGSNTFV